MLVIYVCSVIENGLQDWMSTVSGRVWELFSRGTKIPLGKSFARSRGVDDIEEERASALQLDAFGCDIASKEAPYQLPM